MQRTSRDSKPSAFVCRHYPGGANYFQGFRGYSVFAPTTPCAGQWTVRRPAFPYRITEGLSVNREESPQWKIDPHFPTGSPGIVFELVRSLRDTNGIANS